MALDNLTPAENSTKKIKRVGRGQGSGMGKTASRGANGQKSRTGYKRKRGFEGGQQPLQRRLPKVGFTSKIEKPYVINIDKIKAVAELAEITVDAIRTVHIQDNKVNCNLDIIPSGEVPVNPTELIENGTIDELLEVLKDTYDYI